VRWYGAAPRWCGWLSVWAGTLVDACGAGGGASRFPSSLLLAPGDELLRNVCLPGRIATPLRFFMPRPPARSARCPLRSPTRCHSVHGTAAQPDVNKSPSAPDRCSAKLAEKLQPSITGDTPLHGPPQATPPEEQDTEGGTTGPGRSPQTRINPRLPRTIAAQSSGPRTHGQRSGHEKQGAQPPERTQRGTARTTRRKTNRERPAAGDTNGETRNQRRQPTGPGRSPEINMMIHDDEPSDGEAGDDAASAQRRHHDEGRAAARET
jgi:hypothetical protein